MPGATRSVLINAPIDKVFSTITRYDRYPEFLDEVKKTRVVQRNEGQVDVQYEINLFKQIRYTLRMNEQKPTRVSWTFVEGELMKDNKGSWLLEPEGDALTKVTYNVELTLGPLIPKTIVNTLVDSSLPKMLDAFKKRVESAP